MKPMNITNIVANIGWHSSLWKPEAKTRAFLEKLYVTAKDVLVKRPTGSTFPSLVWRGSNAFAPFGKANDQDVSKFVEEKNESDTMAFFDVWPLTEALGEIDAAIRSKDESALRAVFAKHRVQVIQGAAKPVVSGKSHG